MGLVQWQRPSISFTFLFLPKIRIAIRIANCYHITVASVIAPALLPIDNGLGQNPLRIVFAREALADAALGQAVLFLASVHMDKLERKNNNIETIRNRGEAIRLVNQKLNSPQHGLADTTIGAVGALAATEVSTVRRARTRRYTCWNLTDVH